MLELPNEDDPSEDDPMVELPRDDEPREDDPMVELPSEDEPISELSCAAATALGFNKGSCDTPSEVPEMPEMEDEPWDTGMDDETCDTGMFCEVLDTCSSLSFTSSLSLEPKMEDRKPGLDESLSASCDDESLL